jgi:hypothetical protein
MTQSQTPGIVERDFAYNDFNIHELHAGNGHKYMTTHGMMAKFARTQPDDKTQLTYLLAAPNLTLVQCHFAKECLVSLLKQPRVTANLLVPRMLICHPTTLNLQRLPRASGTSFNVVPFEPECDRKDCDIVSCLIKRCKIKRIDGFMSFDEDVEARLRLAAIVNELNQRQLQKKKK